MKKLFAILLLGFSALAFAAPSVSDVESAISNGNYSQAQSMLRDVVAAHPDSARARYLYAQVLDHNGQYGDALTQINRAHALDPSVHFTDPTRFNAVERHIQADAQRAGARSTGTAALSGTTLAGPAAGIAATPHGPSFSAWAMIAIVIVLVIAVLSWTVRRARTQGNELSQEERRSQLKRATDLLDAIRGLKLDLRLSTLPGHEGLVKEAEDVEAQLRDVVDALSTASSGATSFPSAGSYGPPAQRLDEIERHVISLKARAEGREEPSEAASPYALEAARFGRSGTAVPPGAQQQPVQQPGGMGGFGGLLTGVLLGDVLGNLGRGRDVIVENPGNSGIDPGSGAGWNDNGGGIDVGQGDNNWDSGGSGGFDVGSDDSGGWSDT